MIHTEPHKTAALEARYVGQGKALGQHERLWHPSLYFTKRTKNGQIAQSG